MSWNGSAREQYFTNTEDDKFFRVFYQKDSIKRIEKLKSKNHDFPYSELKKLIEFFTTIVPEGHFACPDWSNEPYKVKVLLVVGRSNLRGALTNNMGRRIGILYGKPLESDSSPQLYVFAFGEGKDNTELTDSRRVKDWGQDWNQYWSDNSNFFIETDLKGHYRKHMIYKNPFSGCLDEKLKEFLQITNESYLEKPNNASSLLGKFHGIQFQGRDEIPIVENVITPLILTTILDENRTSPTTSNLDQKNEEEQIKMNLNTIYYGPPGTGKTHITISKSVEICDGSVGETNTLERYKTLQKDGRIVFVTFHQSYGYEEFIQGLRPIVEKNEGVGNSITYEVIPGVFKKLCDEAKENTEENYVMIIDEINRANISKVFGELITLLEESKRLGGKTPFSVKLPNYLKNNVCDENNIGEDFSVPSNLYVIGTMNTADRSIALLDTALRRRFHFEEMTPDYSILSKDVEGINLQKMLETINSRIEKVYDRDHMIGHAYFFEKTTFKEIQTVFKRQIIPLLTEYFYDDFRKIIYVLNDKKYESFIKKTLFDDQNNEFETRSEIYQINNDVVSLDAIKRIYEGN